MVSLLPDVSKIERFVEAEIAHDDLVRPSIEDGYMSREQLVIARWVRSFCYDNAEAEQRGDQWEEYLPTAFNMAAERFAITVEQAKELWEKSKDLRARNLPGYEEMKRELEEFDKEDR